MLPTIQELLPTIHLTQVINLNICHICNTNYQLRFIQLLQYKVSLGNHFTIKCY